MGDAQLFIDGVWADAQSGETFPTYAPSTGEKIADVAKAGREDAQRAVQAARKAAGLNVEDRISLTLGGDDELVVDARPVAPVDAEGGAVGDVDS